MNDYENLTDLGKKLGVTRNRVGKWLVPIGLRTHDLKPSRLAFEEGFVKAIPHGRNQDGYFYIWHRKKTLAALIEAGHKLAEPASPPIREHPLVAPFTCEVGSTSGFIVSNRNGEAVAGTDDETTARFLTRMLNLANKYNALPGQGANGV